MRITANQVAPPPIDRVAQWATHYNGRGPVIDASQGLSGATPPELPGLNLDDLASYGTRRGSKGLRTALVADLRKQYDAVTIDIGDVLVTAGCNEAFCIATGPLLDGASRIVLLTPYYFNHDMWLRLHGVTPTYVEVTSDGDLGAGADLLEESFDAVVAVSPGNPTGVELAEGALKTLVKSCKSHNAAFILDETYCSFRKDPLKPPHAIYEDPDWREYFISLRSLSKEFSIPGHRVGALIAGEALMSQALKWHDCVSIAAPAPGQAFSEAALTTRCDWRDSLAETIRKRGTTFDALLRAEGSCFHVDSWGGFFSWVSYPQPELTDEDAAYWLASELGILTLPGSYFSPARTGHVRASFAGLSGPQLLDVGERLRGWRQ